MKKDNQDLHIEKEITMSAGQANLRALIFLVPLIIILVVPYYFLWPEQFTKAQITKYVHIKEAWSLLDWAIILAIITTGIIIHEFLHGLGWSFYTKNGWKSIKFGVMWSFLTPYCHCAEPLAMKSYRIGSIFPAIILGFIPSLIAITSGNMSLMVFGFFFTFAASGDFLMLWLLRREKNNVLVQDHAEKIGCIIISNPN